MPGKNPRPFTKPEGYESRVHDRVGESATDAQSPSFVFARSRAEALGLTVETLLRRDREQLRVSSYPGPECLEPFEVEQYASGVLASDRTRHVEACPGCRVLVSGAMASPPLSSFLDDVRNIEPDPEALLAPKRVFWLDLISVPAGAGATMLSLYLIWRFGGPVASDPSVRAAVLGRLQGWSGVGLLLLWLASLGGLLAARFTYRDLLVWSRGALASGLIFGLFAAGCGWMYLDHTAQALRTAVTLSQVQLTRELATSCKPYLLNNSKLDLCSARAWSFPLMTVATSQTATNRLLFRSQVEGVPGSMLADIGPDGGRFYWNVAKEKQTVGTILVGTVKSSSSDHFVLNSPDGTTHRLQNQTRMPKVADGSDVLVLIDAKSQAVLSFNTLSPKDSSLQ